MEELKGSLRIGAVSSSRGDGYVSFELDDDLSGIGFIEIRMSYEDFGRLVGSNVSVDCTYTVRGKDNIGKKYEWKRGSFQIPANEYRRLIKGVKYEDQRRMLGDWLKENAKEEGWHISASLSSRDSIVGSGYDDKPVTLNFNYYRYVDQKQNESNG